MKSHRGPLRSAADVREIMRAAYVPKRTADEHVGLVRSVHRTRIDVWEAERVLSIELPKGSGSDPADLAVGDQVAFEQLAGGDCRLLGVLERRSEIARPDPGDARRRLVLAANVDVALIVVSAARPAFKPGLIDRFLIVLQRGGVTPIVCVNKSDLCVVPAERAAIQQTLDAYVRLGIRCYWTSIESGEGLVELPAEISAKTVVLVGQSGVGKSSLLNALDPDHERVTGNVRAADGKGRHTTTASTLYQLAGGVTLIDTPGIRSLGLWQTTRSELASEFEEFEPYVTGCQFRNCLHAQEPDCAVREASERGEIDAARFASYLRILASLED